MRQAFCGQSPGSSSLCCFNMKNSPAATRPWAQLAGWPAEHWERPVGSRSLRDNSEAEEPARRDRGKSVRDTQVALQRRCQGAATAGRRPSGQVTREGGLKEAVRRLPRAEQRLPALQGGPAPPSPLSRWPGPSPLLLLASSSPSHFLFPVLHVLQTLSPLGATALAVPSAWTRLPENGVWPSRPSGPAQRPLLRQIPATLLHFRSCSQACCGHSCHSRHPGAHKRRHRGGPQSSGDPGAQGPLCQAPSPSLAPVSPPHGGLGFLLPEQCDSDTAAKDPPSGLGARLVVGVLQESAPVIITKTAEVLSPPQGCWGLSRGHLLGPQCQIPATTE